MEKFHIGPLGDFIPPLFSFGRDMSNVSIPMQCLTVIHPTEIHPGSEFRPEQKSGNQHQGVCLTLSDASQLSYNPSHHKPHAPYQSQLNTLPKV